MKDYVQQHNLDLYNFFPVDYFSSSHTPVINVLQETAFEQKEVFLNITNCRFKDQYNIQILGTFPST